MIYTHTLSVLRYKGRILRISRPNFSSSLTLASWFCLVGDSLWWEEMWRKKNRHVYFYWNVRAGLWYINIDSEVKYLIILSVSKTSWGPRCQFNISRISKSYFSKKPAIERKLKTNLWLKYPNPIKCYFSNKFERIFKILSCFFLMLGVNYNVNGTFHLFQQASCFVRKEYEHYSDFNLYTEKCTHVVYYQYSISCCCGPLPRFKGSELL